MTYEARITVFRSDLSFSQTVVEGSRTSVSSAISSALNDNPGFNNVQIVIREKS